VDATPSVPLLGPGRVVRTNFQCERGQFVKADAVFEIAQSDVETPAGMDRVLTPDALTFVARLHQEFEPRRNELLRQRDERQTTLRFGALPAFLNETAHIRSSNWRVATVPGDLENRRVEITGPVDRKMMINALNSGAQVFMADFEDSLSPTWSNVVEGQANLQDAVRRELSFCSPEGKEYRLNETIATLVVRPRGWHLVEKHCTVAGRPVSASLFDFGLYFYHNARALLARGTGPYFYLPKLESHQEARLWNDVFNFAQDTLDIPRGTIRATVLIETILAAFEMEEILYELRAHAAGLNAGRWDYIFSTIKKFAHRSDFILPDRAQVTMAVPFMSAYADLLVQTCHRRGAHAIGGMAAFIPNRKDADVTERALAKVREDKVRESNKGFDGTWVAHPDLVPIAGAVFENVLGERPHQKDGLREDVQVSARDLLDVHIADGRITRAGVATNIEVALLYLDAWLRGTGAVAIHNLMEDVATAEISRAQLWQWRVHESPMDDGTILTRPLYRELRAEQLARLQSARNGGESRLDDAARLLDELVLSAEFAPFLTLASYRQLD
jgi:malate synthase